MTTVSTQELFTESVGDLQQQPELSPFDSCILYYIIFGSCFGGFRIIAIMGREKKKSTTINCLFMLAISDSLVLFTHGCMIIPLGIRKYFFGWWNGHNNYIALTYGVELARTFNQVSAFITMLVTFQRYVSDCLPHRAKQLCSVRLVNIITAVSYIVSILFFLPNFFLYVIVEDSVTHSHLHSRHLDLPPISMPETRSRSSTNIITNEELDLMITEAVEAALQKTKEFFLKKIAEMQKVCDEQQLQIDKLKEQVESNNDVNSNCKQDIRNLTISINNLEQYSRRSNIRINGLAVKGMGNVKKPCVRKTAVCSKSMNETSMLPILSLPLPLLPLQTLNQRSL
ncbi:hypothetical protein CAPTEDRAFT_214449 [Capitella teleta]|uniref:G-protein coupled receptors family 1 profile domain-containing protein n=1 Tax=Capitella teleta TaxID=283909 RepID=R7UR33_CAPTE|nr:hypothetical protein CAPTEDRAFT_214449 [Capitella teleta]|eukprot:ELU08999.1 hypothetical protein CAPTEDRAFT_214449 [Capitella teleta]